MQIHFRPVTEEDREFLYLVYAGTREEELAVTGWRDAEKAAFLWSQFEAQSLHYQEHFSGASFHVILRDGESVGRLYVDRRRDEIRIIDIALLPRVRGQGIGSRILSDILTEAEGAGLPVRIHVEMNNPAMRLYRRLGFRSVAVHGVYLLMERPTQPGLVS